MREIKLNEDVYHEPPNVLKRFLRVIAFKEMSAKLLSPLPPTIQVPQPSGANTPGRMWQSCLRMLTD